MNQRLFSSFFHGGFECATHRARPRNFDRIDMIAATRHDEFAREDYLRLHDVGITTARDGLRWHLIESAPGVYDWSSALSQVRAARDTKTQVIWDLCHYGYPDFLDIFTPAFVDSFARFSRAFALLLKDETDDDVPFISPINEISYFAWGGGGTAWINPFVEGKGFELKVQLARACIAAIEAFWSVFPRARIVHCDPVINVIPDPDYPETNHIAQSVHESQYEAFDMIAGRNQPQLGGADKHLDIVGVNYYWNNQWNIGPPPDHPRLTIVRQDPRYKPFRDVLAEVYRRYARPLYIAETGIEFDERPAWLAYIGEEVRAGVRAGTLVEGICLYPIVNHPGWDDDRHCQNGIWDYPDDDGSRDAYEPLLTELRRQQQMFEHQSSQDS